ncbi:Fic family protein [Vibrio anguillarum]|uniref:Fic family protein n=1 Tax=Vibrio anguillarum TaxID=55601 RepID=UPI002E18CD63
MKRWKKHFIRYPVLFSKCRQGFISNDGKEIILYRESQRNHYQFEAIHPFLDGNGRTGRILNILFLIENDLLSQPILYLSRYIVHNKEDYYRLLLKVTEEGDWESWICFMLDAVKVTAEWTIDKVNAIVELQKQTSLYIKDSASKVYSHELVELLFEKPYLRAKDLLEREIYRSRQAGLCCNTQNNLSFDTTRRLDSYWAYQGEQTDLKYYIQLTFLVVDC